MPKREERALLARREQDDLAVLAEQDKRREVPVTEEEGLTNVELRDGQPVRQPITVLEEGR